MNSLKLVHKLSDKIIPTTQSKSVLSSNVELVSKNAAGEENFQYYFEMKILNRRMRPKHTNNTSMNEKALLWRFFV